MREIKFRGKRVEKRVNNGEWIYGSLINNVFYKAKDNTPCCYITPDTGFEWGDCWEDYACQIDDFEVIPESVGQYTGLKDKNNIDIYEGDILKTDSGIPVFIEYRNDMTMFVCRMSTNSASMSIEQAWEVIGNLYEHPQLIEKQLNK